MATFKVGQRVRVANSPHVKPAYVGKEGIFLRYEKGWFHNCVALIAGETLFGNDNTLLPLTDPGCESFITAMRDFAAKNKTPLAILRESFKEKA